MDKDIERRLDGWAGSYDWRRSLEQGEITEDELLTQLANLEEGLCQGCYLEPCICLPDDAPCDE